MKYTIFYLSQRDGAWRKDWTTASLETLTKLLAGWEATHHQTVVIVD